MSEEKKETPRTLSRRQFLRDVGVVSGGAIVGSTLFLAGCREEVEVTKTVTETEPPVTETETVTRYICPMCADEFDSLSALISHMEAEHPEEVKEIAKFVCPLCTEKFDSLSALQSHVKDEHPVVKGNTVPQAHIFWDPLLCTGCQTCQLICSTARRGRTSPLLSAIGGFHDDFGSDRDYEPCPCLLCEDPSCLKLCRFDAIFIDPVLGIAVIDEEKCNKDCGGLCQAACPFSPSRIFGPDPDTNTFFKCDLCHGDPLCVRWCPNGALKFKTLAELTPDAVNGIPVESSYRLELLEEREKELGYPRGEGK